MAESLVVESVVALITLTALEIVLGIDNILVISIMTNRLPAARQRSAQLTGLALAMVMRILLLFSLKWIMGLTAAVFTVFGHAFSWRDLIMLGGGLFLMFKAVVEIHKNVEGEVEAEGGGPRHAGYAATIVQILLLDLVFSLDSVITAVGMARELWVMVTAVIVAVLVMMAFAGPISRFVERHPTIRVLALAFLLLIALTLILEGWGKHVEKPYLYFAMGFSLFVELLNLRVIRRIARRKPPKAIPSTH